MQFHLETDDFALRDLQVTCGDSLVVGDLAGGCTRCMEGLKMVLFITGICGRGCFYCPYSLERQQRDVTFANERSVKSDEDIIEEVRIMRALGTGITGGEPLLFPDRTIHYIKLLKETFGAEHHIHLYTGSQSVKSPALFKRLKDAGLDEIRIHPLRKDWHKIKWAVNAGLTTGAEIPVIPDNLEEMKKFAVYVEKAGGRFLNMNELEFSETNYYAFQIRGLHIKPNSLAAVQGSEETAHTFLEWARNNLKTLTVHYCPSTLKDRHQLRRRLFRRAELEAKPYEERTEEGTLIKASITHEKATLIGLNKLQAELQHLLPELAPGMMHINQDESSLETSVGIAIRLEETLRRAGWKISVLEEYPTAGRLRVATTQLASE